VGADRRLLQEKPLLKISIVVPAFNEERLLGAALESIKAAAKVFDEAGWELIVCDNNSTDRTAEIARAAGARVVFEPHNQISRARNCGAAAATGEWLVFVDADTSPSPELFRDLESAIDSGGCLGGGSTFVADSDSFGFRLGVRAWNVISRITRWGAGAFIYCDAAAFRELGGFSEELYASEELDFFQRLKLIGRRLGRRILILHRHPLRTSDRKVRLYSWRELFGLLGRFMLHPRRAPRNAADCSAWYDGRR
jgi:glycosyltransferase involved in cell wall biosynthesis